MVVVIIKWYIKFGMEKKFIKHWESMKPASYEGLFREFLNKAGVTQDERFITLDIENHYYSTFINVGLWRSLNDFDKAIGQFIPKREAFEDNPELEFYKVYDFEFKMRERIVLNGERNREGLWSNLPPSINPNQQE